MRESIVSNQLAKMKERGTDLTVFSPRASFMAHHIGDFEVSHLGGDLQRAVFRVAQLFPITSSRGHAAAEPGRRSEDLHPRAGKVRRASTATSAINLNPDPSGGHWTSRR